MTGGADDQIAALRAAVGASTDMELADMLGVGRSTISQWRKRASVPSKYKFLIQPSDEQFEGAINNALRIHIFGNRNNAYLVAAILSAAPASMFEKKNESAAERGRRLEVAIARIANTAILAVNADLRKEKCEDEADYEALVELLNEKYTDEIGEICTRYGGEK